MRKNNILIIDQNIITIFGLKNVLEYQYNCSVFFSIDQKDITDFIKNGNISLIIIDLFQDDYFNLELYDFIMNYKTKCRILFYSDFNKYEKLNILRKKNCFNFNKNDSLIKLLKILDSFLNKSENESIIKLFNHKNKILLQREKDIKNLLLNGNKDTEICQILNITDKYLTSMKKRIEYKSSIDTPIELNILATYI